MKQIRINLSVFLLLLVFICPYGHTQEKMKTIDDLLDQYHAYGLFNGSALVAENGRIILKKGYGLANMEHPERPRYEIPDRFHHEAIHFDDIHATRRGRKNPARWETFRVSP